MAFALISLSSSSEAIAKQVACEEISYMELGFLHKEYKTCFITKATIDTIGFTISSSRDDYVGILRFWGNRNIFYLPVKVHEKFNNLMGYYAPKCSIKFIAKANFEKLFKLRYLMFDDNQIERISSDTFEGLMSLDTIHLSN